MQIADKNALKLKRREQLNAVKTIFAMDNIKKRNTLIVDLINGMQKVSHFYDYFINNNLIHFKIKILGRFYS